MLAVVPLLLGSAYKDAVDLLPASYLVGGCVNPGLNPGPEDQVKARNDLVQRFGWSILTDEAADQMAAFVEGSAVDFGAGTGYVSHLLHQRGVDVLAIDNWSSGQPEHTWHLVQSGSFEDLRGTSDRALILGWPPKGSLMALTALRAWSGTRLVYIGEIMRGTADPAFHNELAKNWHLVERVKVPQWRNRSDAIFLFERRDGAGDGWAWMNAEMAKCTTTVVPDE
jgi:hypothetical protein